jgi:monomeric sarcosine oxidase
MSEGLSVIVVGGGTMGLATAWALARRGVASTVLERHHLVHDHGSHSGFTRVIRQAYHEGSGYVPLVQQAQREFVALQQRSGRPLLVQTGLAELGAPDDPDLQASIAACRAHGVHHELVDAAEARRRWPLRVPDDWVATFTPSGGYLRVRDCLEALADEARDGGARVLERTTVRHVDVGGDRPTVILANGDRLEADRVVVTAGAGLPELLPDVLPGKLVRLRRLLAWTDPPPEHHAALAAMPVWGAFVPTGFWYGFPYGDVGIRGLKLGCHTSSAIEGLDDPVDPQTVDRSAHETDLAPLRAFLQAYLPMGRGRVVAHRVCLYTATPSWDFVIDRHPDDPRVVLAGGFSGHGFKFAPTIGRLVADLVTTDAPAPTAFCIDRHR